MTLFRSTEQFGLAGGFEHLLFEREYCSFGTCSDPLSRDLSIHL